MDVVVDDDKFMDGKVGLEGVDAVEKDGDEEDPDGNEGKVIPDPEGGDVDDVGD